MIHYILRMFFPHLNITKQLTLVKSDILHPSLGIWSFKGGTLVDGRFFLADFGISLEEGLQLGFAHAFLHDM
jgi:hypothetical protein